MGLVQHKSIIISSQQDLFKLSKEIEDIYMNEFHERFIELDKFLECVNMSTIINGVNTLFIGPSGSNVNWPEYDLHDEFFKRVIEHIDSKAYEDKSNSFGYVFVEYGEEGSNIINTNYINKYTEHCNVKLIGFEQIATFYECTCGYDFIIDNDKYCGGCGKPIEWGDVE